MILDIKLSTVSRDSSDYRLKLALFSRRSAGDRVQITLYNGSPETGAVGTIATEHLLKYLEDLESLSPSGDLLDIGYDNGHEEFIFVFRLLSNRIAVRLNAKEFREHVFLLIDEG